MKRLSLILLLIGCGSEEPVPSNVEGTLDGRQLVLGGGGWAWEEPRESAGQGGVFRLYQWHLELSGVAFDATTGFETLELAERHALAQQVALRDRLSFTLQLTGINDQVRGDGSRYDPTTAQGDVDLTLGSLRADDEPADAEPVQPVSVASDRGWVLLVDEITLPANGAAGRLKGSLELAITRQTTDLPNSLTGNLAIDFDVPFVGSWLGQCQKALLLDPEGQHCPR